MDENKHMKVIHYIISSVQFSSVQSLSCVSLLLFVTP